MRKGKSHSQSNITSKLIKVIYSRSFSDNLTRQLLPCKSRGPYIFTLQYYFLNVFRTESYGNITMARVECHRLDGWCAKGVLGMSGAMLAGYQLTDGFEPLHHCYQVFWEFWEWQNKLIDSAKGVQMGNSLRANNPAYFLALTFLHKLSLFYKVRVTYENAFLTNSQRNFFIGVRPVSSHQDARVMRFWHTLPSRSLLDTGCASGETLGILMPIHPSILCWGGTLSQESEEKIHGKNYVSHDWDSMDQRRENGQLLY